jgi:hypothetical protein
VLFSDRPGNPARDPEGFASITSFAAITSLDAIAAIIGAP